MLGLGDDILVLHLSYFEGDVAGDGLEDGTANTGDGGDDYMLIDAINPIGIVAGDKTVGNGGNDTIIVSYIRIVAGDIVTGAGGNDYILVELSATDGLYGDYSGGDGGDDTIILDGAIYQGMVAGDLAGGDGGDDTIVINGFVYNGVDVCGDFLTGGGNGGDDTITVNGTVYGDVLGDCVARGIGGNDRIIIGDGAIVYGVIDGEGGNDILNFLAALQSDLNLLDPAGGTITIGGQTYNWRNFETLLGIVQAIQSNPEVHRRIIATGSAFFAIESQDELGINVIGKHGRIAFIPYQEVAKIKLGASMNFSAANSAGWYVTVTNLSLTANRTTLFGVSIFDASHGLQGEFTFNN